MVGIVIQGHTKHYIDLSIFYSQFPNVVWSTWDDEPVENIKHIQSKGIQVITSEKPKFPGYLNVNLQLYSSLKGVEYFKNKGIKEVIKVRSDIIWEGIDLIWDRLKGKKIGFLNLNTPPLKKYIEYDLDYPHKGFDFPSDHVIFGQTDILIATFQTLTTELNNVPPESIILRNYLFSQGYSTSFSPQNLKNSEVYLSAQDCKDFNNKILWVKLSPPWDLVALSFNPHEGYLTSL